MSIEMNDTQRDILKILPKSSAKKGMTEDEVKMCLDELHNLRVGASLVKLFEDGKVVPRVRDGEVYWGDRELVEKGEEKKVRRAKA